MIFLTEMRIKPACRSVSGWFDGEAPNSEDPFNWFFAGGALECRHAFERHQVPEFSSPGGVILKETSSAGCQKLEFVFNVFVDAKPDTTPHFQTDPGHDSWEADSEKSAGIRFPQAVLARLQEPGGVDGFHSPQWKMTWCGMTFLWEISFPQRWGCKPSSSKSTCTCTMYQHPDQRSTSGAPPTMLPWAGPCARICSLRLLVSNLSIAWCHFGKDGFNIGNSLWVKRNRTKAKLQKRCRSTCCLFSSAVLHV